MLPSLKPCLNRMQERATHLIGSGEGRTEGEVLQYLQIMQHLISRWNMLPSSQML